MGFQPLTELRIQSFRCIQEVSVKLTPLHAFIGPNDSGKSTVLRALNIATNIAHSDNANDWFPELPEKASVGFTWDGGTYSVERSGGALKESVSVRGSIEKTLDRTPNMPGLLGDPSFLSLKEAGAQATLLHLSPRSLRAKAPMLLNGEHLRLKDEYGSGLAAVLAAINQRDVDGFVRLREATKQLFPTVANLRILTEPEGKVSFQATLSSGAIVRADEMSEGLLYYIAFATLQHVEGQHIFLVEEPENGLHPSRVAEVMSILRALSTNNQVILATHSPFVINECAPEEVTILTRDESGTHARRIDETPRFEERSKVYALGELWVSYANGRDEAPLLNGEARQ
ncbi:MAG: AAA family ATPase [Polyangiaceae bacterium]